MSRACPACGVAVVPGYVRCPKCSAPMPHTQVRAATAAGGTVSVEGGGLPVVPIAIGAIVVVGIIVMFATRGGGGKPASAAGSGSDETEETDGVPQPTPVDDDDGTPAFTPTPAQPSGPDPSAAIAELQRALTRERLWGTVELAAPRIDVRSGGCDDPKMGAVLDAASGPLRDGGLTKLRCVAQSGRVVLERDL